VSKSVFLLTTGSYSDYGVRAAFSTRKLAEQFLRKYKQQFSDGGIEEYALDPVIQTQHIFAVTILPDGSKRAVCDITQRFLDDENCYGLENLTGGPHWEVRDVDVGRPAGCGVKDASFTVWCHMRDEEHGLKIARDAMRGVVALGLWKHGATGTL
jgi:hypothetical protein